MIAEEALATVFAGLIGLDIIAGGWPTGRPGRKGRLAAMAHPWTTARRSLRNWAYRRYLRRVDQRATRADWYDWEPNADLAGTAFEEYARGIGTISTITEVDWDARVIDSLVDLQRATINRGGVYLFGVPTHIDYFGWSHLLRAINDLRADFDNS